MTAGGNSFRNATAHKVNSYYTLAISYCTFCVGRHTIVGPGFDVSSDAFWMRSLNCKFTAEYMIISLKEF